MKIGTRIICIDSKGIDARIKNQPKEMEIYTVRDISYNIMKGIKGVLLNEIHNEPVPHPMGIGNFEPNFNIKRFAELMEDVEVKEEISEEITA